MLLLRSTNSMSGNDQRSDHLLRRGKVKTTRLAGNSSAVKRDKISIHSVIQKLLAKSKSVTLLSRQINFLIEYFFQNFTCLVTLSLAVCKALDRNVYLCFEFGGIVLPAAYGAHQPMHRQTFIEDSWSILATRDKLFCPPLYNIPPVPSWTFATVVTSPLVLTSPL